MDVRQLSDTELKQLVGIVLQESILFEGTIRSNVSYGNENCTDEAVDTALRIAQATEFVEEREDGILSEVAARGKNLSGGQKQRVSLARTLLGKPKILILDDSSSALDMATSAKLQQAIRDNLSGSTLIEVAQRIATVMHMDHILVLGADGRISGFGTHEELLHTNETYRSIAVSQLGEEVLNG